MEKHPLVSIVTISFNSVSTIERTIRSVLNQTYENIEYIVIDGGSSDGTVEILKKHDGKIAYWESNPDRGISNAFNKGIDKARGGIVGIINSDDWYEIDAVESVVRHYQKTKADVIFGDIYFPEDEFLQKGDPDYSTLIKYFMPTLNHPSCFVTNKTYKRHGVFDENYKIAMDYDLLKRLHDRKVSFSYINKTITNMSRGGVSNKMLIRRYWETLKVAGFHPLSFGLAGYNYLTRFLRITGR